MAAPSISSAFGQDDEEEDFMSDKFLAMAESTSKATRHPNQSAQKKKGDGRVLSRAQRELKAREEGLRRDLMSAREESPSGEAESKAPSSGRDKALEMMRKMGYQTGQGLGKRKEGEADEMDPSEASVSATGDHKKARTSGGTSKALAEPLALDTRWLSSSRKGIGSAQVLRQAIFEAARKAKVEFDSGETQRKQEEAMRDFRTRATREHEERRMSKTLDKARRMTMDLDRREGQEYSPLWIDSEWLHLKPTAERPLPQEIKQILDAALGADDEEDFAAKKEGSNSGAPPDKGIFEGLDEGEGDAETQTNEGQRNRAERREEARRWVSLDPPTRLSITLDHLRAQHRYCIWCGSSFSDAQEMADLCPGLTEEEHD